jgi:hypothetical protein
MKLKYLTPPTVLFFLTLPICAQTIPSVTQQAQDRELRNNTIENRANAGGSNQNGANGTYRNREIDNVEIPSKPRNPTPIYKKPVLSQQDIEAIAVNPEDKTEFEDFLKAKKTGIIRLHDADVCPTTGYIVEAYTTCPLNIVNNATAYSFRVKNYSLSKFADLYFKGNKLSVSGVFTLGVASNLGDVNINNLNLASDGVKQLYEFKPSDDENEVNHNWKMLDKGIQVDNFIYKREVELVENNTYVLRVVAYRGNLLELQNDKRKDIIVVFRTIRKHEDGSLTLVWKELKRINSPKINR